MADSGLGSDSSSGWQRLHAGNARASHWPDQLFSESLFTLLSTHFADLFGVDRLLLQASSRASDLFKPRPHIAAVACVCRIEHVMQAYVHMVEIVTDEKEMMV